MIESNRTTRTANKKRTVHKGMLLSFALALLCASSSPTLAQTPFDQKDLKKNGQVPLLHRERSAQQVYQQLMQMEDERKLENDFPQYFTNTHAGIRRRAALTVGRIGDRSSNGVLGESLIDDGNPRVREADAFALGESEDPRAIRVLISSLLNSGETIEVRGRAAEALGKIASQPENIKVLGADVSERINNLLINALPKPPSEIKLGQDQFVSLVLTALLRVHPVTAIDPVAAQLSSPNAQVRFVAANSLARILAANPGKATKVAVDAALTATRDAVPLVRATAARVLGAAKDPGAVEALIGLLKDEDEQTQVGAIRALGSIGDKRGAAPLIKMGEQLLTQYQSAKDIQGPELNRLYLIATALGELKDAAALPLLKSLRLLPKKTIGSNVETEIAIASFGPEAFFGYDAKQDMQYADWQAAANFANGLGELGGEQAIKTLDDLLAGKRIGNLDARAVPDILRAMVKVKSPSALNAIRDQLKAEDIIARATAAELIVDLSKSEDDFNLLNSAYTKAASDNMNDAKLAILAAMAQFPKAQATPVLNSALKDSDYLVRKQAADLLRMINVGNFDNSVGKVNTTRNAAFYKEVFENTNHSKPIIAELTTSKGVIRMELFDEEAPLTVNNFVTLAKKGYYNRVTFHRVVPNFVAQGGDPRGDGNGGPGYQIRCEINTRPYIRGTVGMALSGKDTGGSQFFICHSPQPHLDGGYTVFGQVISGMEVVDKIVRGDLIEKVTIIESQRDSGDNKKLKTDEIE